MLPFIAISVSLCINLHFLKIDFFQSTKLDPNHRLSIDVGVKEKSNARLNKLKLQLMMPSKAGEFFF